VNGHQKGEFRNTLLLLYFLKKIELNQDKGKYFHIPTLFLKKIFLALTNAPQPTCYPALVPVYVHDTFCGRKRLLAKNFLKTLFLTYCLTQKYKTQVYSNLENPGDLLFFDTKI